MKTLEAVNTILLQSGERQVREVSSPPSLKAKQAIEEAIQEFSLLADWANFTRWTTPVSWAGAIATLPTNTIKIIGCKDGNTLLTFIDNWGILNPCQWTIVSHNKAQVYSDANTVNTQFLVVLLPSLPENDVLDIDIPQLYLTAILKRALALFVLRHMDDANTASQFTAEYELMVTQLRSRNTQRPNGSANMFRNGR